MRFMNTSPIFTTWSFLLLENNNIESINNYLLWEKQVKINGVDYVLEESYEFYAQYQVTVNCHPTQTNNITTFNCS